MPIFNVFVPLTLLAKNASMYSLVNPESRNMTYMNNDSSSGANTTFFLKYSHEFRVIKRTVLAFRNASTSFCVTLFV